MKRSTIIRRLNLSGLLKQLIHNSSKAGDTILDCFLGSGTTAVCAKAMGRNFIGMEVDEAYYDTACQRVSETLFDLT